MAKEFEVPKALKPIAAHGVVFDGTKSGGHLVADCPFCGDDQHFFANPDNGQWKCHKCTKKGNAVTFMSLIAEQRAREHPSTKMAELCKLRGLPEEAMRLSKVGWDGKFYLIPCFSGKGTVRNIRRWLPGSNRLMATAGAPLQLWGADRLASSPEGAVVWICEGEWDGVALRWLFSAMGITDVVVATPGADVFKDEWAALFNGKRVRIVGDNDEAGDRMDEKIGKILKTRVKEMLWVNWPEMRPDGWDTRDHIRHLLEKNTPLKRIHRRLRRMLKPNHRHRHQDPDGVPVEGGEAPADEGYEPQYLPDSKIPTFEKIKTVFKKWINVDADMEYGLRTILAVILSEQMEGDPLWFYVVGPPGGGKTLLLSSTQASDKTIFRSNVTPHSLVSGFKTEPDPSLLAKVNKRTLIFKDGTEMLQLPDFQRAEIYSILRGSYDGQVERSYGNNVHREYHLHYSMLFGVTEAIFGHREATLGERFLKFYMPFHGNRDEKIEAALDNSSHEKEMEEAIQGIVTPFLCQRINLDKLPEVPAWVRSRLVALSQLLAMLRASVERDRWNDNEMKYRPGFEVGTRIAKQLQKFGRALAIVAGKGKIGYNEYKLVERVAMDTAVGFHRDIAVALAGYGKEMTRELLAVKAKMSSSTLTRNLEDLLELGVVIRRRDEDGDHDHARGVKPYLWALSPKVAELWKRAGVGRPPKRPSKRKRQ